MPNRYIVALLVSSAAGSLTQSQSFAQGPATAYPAPQPAAPPQPAAAAAAAPPPGYLPAPPPNGQWGSVPPPPPPPTSSAAPTPNGEYVAPLYQQTQPYYLPQSVALSGPRMIKDWQEGQPMPYGYHAEKRVRTGLVIGGAITFGVPYIYSGLIAAAASDSSSSNKVDALFIPVLGPFVEMTNVDSTLGRYVLALDGLAQGAGAFMLVYGLVSPRTVLVRNDLAMMTVTPMRFGKDGTGFGVVGIF